jgi:SAM-dependent methyltransferase
LFVPREGVAGSQRVVQLESDALTPDYPTTLSAAEEEPANLYRYPALYDALKTPDAGDVAVLAQILERFVGAGPWAMLDPACGPGNWLRPFADGRNQLVGNDYCFDMVAWAARELRRKRCKVLHGDMYRLDLAGQRFEVVFEASGVTSIVPDLATLAAWIAQLGSYLKPNGAVVLLFNFTSPLPAQLPHLLWRTPWLKMAGGGSARLQYELLEDLSHTGTQRILRTVSTRGMRDVPERLAEDYELRIWTRADLEGLRSALKQLSIAAVLDPQLTDPFSNHAAEPVGERYVVFKP